MRRLAPAGLDLDRGDCVGFLGAAGPERTALLESIAEARRDAVTVCAGDLLFRQLTVAGNVGFGLPDARRTSVLHDLLAFSGLDRVAGRAVSGLPAELRARVLLLRACATGRALVLDEPFAGLPARERSAMHVLLRRLVQLRGMPVVLATADRIELLACGDRIGVIEGGAVARVDSVETMLAQPGSAFAAEALLDAQLFPGRVVEEPHDRDDADIQLACGGIMPAQLAESVGPGDLCLVAIRPEQIAFLPVRMSDVGGAAIPVTLLDVRHLGDHLRLRVRLEDGSQIWIRRPAASLTPRDIGLASESRGASLAWRASHAIAYPNI